MSAPLPKGWALRPLPEIAQINPPLNRCVKGDDTPVTFAPMRAVGVEGSGFVAPETRSYGEVKRGFTAFRPGDIIMAKITPCMENGKTMLVPEVPSGVCFGSTEFHVIRPEAGISGKWIELFLLRQETRRDAQREMGGAVGQMRVPAAFLQSLQVPVPPQAEQSRIVQFIEETSLDLNAGIATLQRCQKKLADYRAAVLNAAVKGDLTADWRERNPGVEHWRRVAFDQIATIQGGLQKSPARAPKQHHYPYLRVANVHRGKLHLDELRRFELTPEELRKLRLEPGDILLVEGNGSRKEIGRCALWNGEVEDCVHQNHIIRARLEEGVLPQYVSIFLNSPTGQLAIQQAANSTSGLYTLSVKKVKALSIALPPVAEQRAIVDAVASHVSAVDAISKDLTEKLSQANSLRQSLLHRAFTGNLAPQNASDEPAAKLLERIARERKARQRRKPERGVAQAVHRQPLGRHKLDGAVGVGRSPQRTTPRIR